MLLSLASVLRMKGLIMSGKAKTGVDVNLWCSSLPGKRLFNGIVLRVLLAYGVCLQFCEVLNESSVVIC